MSESAPTVFISYAHEDEAWKDQLVAQLRVLEFEGDLDVWQDREIAAGDDWQPPIEQAIDRARVAVLLISTDFLNSDFIRGSEVPRILARRASEGLRVIPLIVRPCPWQAVDWLAEIQARPKDGRALSAGNKHQIEDDLSVLALEIRGLLGDASASPSPAEPPEEQMPLKPPASPSPEPSGQPHALRFGWLLLPTFLAALLALAASSWRLPTHVEVALTTRRLAFTVGGAEARKVLNVSVPFSSLVIERCKALTFVPAELAVLHATGAGSEAEPGWTQVTPEEHLVRLACYDPDAKLALRSPEHRLEPSLGTFDRIWVDAGSQFILEVAEGPEVDGGRELELTADIELAQSLTIAVEGELEIESEFAVLEGAGDPPVVGDYLTYRARLESPDAWLDLRFQRGLTLIVVPPVGAADDLFVSAPIPVKDVDFLDENLDGEIESPLLSEARLSYPEFSGLPAVTVPRGELLGIGDLGTAQLEQLELDPATAGLRLVFDGIAGKARSTDRAFTRDYRLTVWDRFAHGKLWNRLAAVAIWALSTVLLGIERLKKLSGAA